MIKPKLTAKQRKFADKYIETGNATQSALQAYNTDDYSTAANIGSDNLNKPNIAIYLDRHVDKAKNRVVQLIDSEKEDIALRASESVLDRALGKAVQRQEVHATSVNLNLDLSQITDTQQ